MMNKERLAIRCAAAPEGCEIISAEIHRRHTCPVSRGGRGRSQAGCTGLIHPDGSIKFKK